MSSQGNEVGLSPAGEGLTVELKISKSGTHNYIERNPVNKGLAVPFTT
jgi:hypothetical protein